MTRKYADISHFRAPFKNWPYLGMGPGAAGMGAAAPDAAASPLDPANVIDVVDGVRIFKPVVADQIMKFLTTQSVVFLDDNNVKLDPKVQGDIRQSGDSWVKQKLSEGKTVVAGTVGGAQLFGLPLTVDRYLSAVKGHDAEVTATAGLTPLGAVLVRPSLLSGMFGKLGPVGIAAVSLLAVGGFIMWSKKKKRGGHHGHAVANRRSRPGEHYYALIYKPSSRTPKAYEGPFSSRSKAKAAGKRTAHDWGYRRSEVVTEPTWDRKWHGR